MEGGSRGLRDFRRRELRFFRGAQATSGIVQNVHQLNFDGLTAHAFCVLADFPVWYDVLRNERPLTCTFRWAGPDNDPSQPTRDLEGINIRTGEEPPGEGSDGLALDLFPAGIIKALRGEPQGDQ